MRSSNDVQKDIKEQDSTSKMLASLITFLSNTKFLTSASIATVADRLLLNPIDTVITVQQTKHTSARHITKSIMQSEGWLGFYRGMTWPLVAAIPSRLSVFSTYFATREYIPQASNYSQRMSDVIASVVSGITYTIVGGPAEAKRTREVMKVKIDIGHFHPLALYKGFWPLLARSCVGNTIQLAGSDYLLSFVPKSNKYSNWAPFVSGTITGVIAQFVITPLDVLKTRVMCDYSNKTLWHHTKAIVREGLIFNSLKTRVLRIGLGSGVMIGVISSVTRFIDNLSENKTPKPR